MPNKNFKPQNIFTADEWKLVSLLNELLEPFYIVRQKCSKNSALQSSVILYAAATNFFFNNKAKNPLDLDQSSSTTLAKNIEKALERKFYATNNSKQTFMITTCF